MKRLIFLAIPFLVLMLAATAVALQGRLRREQIERSTFPPVSRPLFVLEINQCDR